MVEEENVRRAMELSMLDVALVLRGGRGGSGGPTFGAGIGEASQAEVEAEEPHMVPGVARDAPVAEIRAAYRKLALAKPFMSKKLRGRIAVLNGENPDKLLQYIPSSALPAEHGGTLPFDEDAWSAKMIADGALEGVDSTGGVRSVPRVEGSGTADAAIL